MEQIIGMRPMSQFDYYSRPLSDVFAAEPDLTPYEPLQPAISLDEKNPPDTPAAKASASLDFSQPDRIDDGQFNRILWLAIKGDDQCRPPCNAPAVSGAVDRGEGEPWMRWCLDRPAASETRTTGPPPRERDASTTRV